MKMRFGHIIHIFFEAVSGHAKVADNIARFYDLPLF
jgi:hypothetical protein